MPITKGAKKVVRASEKKRVYNLRRKRNSVSAVKAVKKMVVAGDTKSAQANLSAAYKALDKAAKMGTIKKGNANRQKSRLVAAIKKAQTK
ncbi:MAG: 30S ribosomal protein S20 [Candidatus Paceibacterota bacterium]